MPTLQFWHFEYETLKSTPYSKIPAIEPLISDLKAQNILYLAIEKGTDRIYALGG